MTLNLNLMSCPKCGGRLKENAEGKYSCSFCERVWEKKIDDTFERILGGVEDILRDQRASDIARLKRALYEQTHREFVSNEEVARLSKDILNHYDDGDFYARFYLAASEESRTALSSFCTELNISEHKEDIPEMLDYLITGLREDWILSVGHIIERAFKSENTDLYSKYRDRFEEMAGRIQDGIYEPTLNRDVFVMYSGKDMDKVLKMVSVLENDYGLSCFVAAKNLRHGAGSADRYKDAIHTAIENCNVYLLISSGNSRSRQCEVYEEILYIMKNHPKKPRVEYLAEDYKGYGMESKFREFFSGLEYCTSYEDTAKRISSYCDEIQMGERDIFDKKPLPAQSEPRVQTETVNAMLLRAKKLLVLEKYELAAEEYEKITDTYSEDVRGYIGCVAVASRNYSILESPEIEKRIKVINSLFGEESAKTADKDYSEYLLKREEEKTKALNEENARLEAEERAKQESAAEAEKRKKEVAAKRAAEAQKKREAEKNAAEDFEIVDGVLRKYKGKSKSVVIPEGVTAIGNAAFTRPEIFEITDIKLPKSVISVSGAAFAIHENVKFEVDKGNPKYYVQDNCLIEAGSKKLVRGNSNSIIPEGILSIGEFAFSYCKNLKPPLIPNSVTSVGRRAFYSCEGLTSLALPEFLRSIGDEAFWSCKNLKKLNIPMRVADIGVNPFLECEQIKVEVDINNQSFYTEGGCLIERKSKRLISGCSGSVIPSGIETIGAQAFWGCSSLAKIIIPNSVRSIESLAFYGCPLKSVSLPDGCKCENNSFPRGCEVSKAVPTLSPAEAKRLREEEARKAAEAKRLEEERIKREAVDRVREAAENRRFAEAQKKAEAEAAERKRNAIQDLMKRAMEADREKKEEEACRLEEEKRKKEAAKKASPTSTPDLVISDGVLKKYNGVDYTVSIPDGIKKIGNNAFQNCKNLRSVTMPESVTEIGDLAFESCQGLKLIHLSKNIKAIGTAAFANCTSLTEFEIPKGLRSLSPHVFSGMSIKSIMIPEHITEIGNNAFSNCKLLKSISLPRGLTKIAGSLFLGCNKLTEITIPEGIAEIAHNAFSGCTALKAVRIPDSVNIIGAGAFENSGLTSVTLPRGIVRVEKNTFMSCYELTRVNLPESLVSIDINAFAFCRALTDISLPKGLMNIESKAFWNAGITTVVLPKKCKSEPDSFPANCKVKHKLF